MTASPGDGEHAAREGYYPDPSIPGYVRYWNGAAWVPGTSRPAPAPAPVPVEETGPVFLDETSAAEALPEPSSGGWPAEPASGRWRDGPSPAGWREEAAPADAWGADGVPGTWRDDPSPQDRPSAPGAGREAPSGGGWQADPAHQAGFGGPRDVRVSWGGPDVGEPEDARPGGISLTRPAAAAPAARRLPAQAAAESVGILSARPPAWPDAPGTGVSGLTSSWPEASPQAAAAPAAAPARPAGPDPGARAGSPLPARSAAPARTTAPAPEPPGPAADPEWHGTPHPADDPAPGWSDAPQLPSAPRPGRKRPDTPAPGPGRAAGPGPAGAVAPAWDEVQDPVPGRGPARERSDVPHTGAPVGYGRAAAPAGEPGRGADPAPARGSVAAWSAGRGRPDAAEAPAEHGRAAAPGPRPEASAPADRAAAPAAPPVPAGPGAHAPASAHAPSSAPAVSPEAPVREDARALFERMAERAVRPAGLARRGLARTVDSLVLAGVAAGAATPLVPGVTAHLQAKVDAARASGRTTTVWLLDATTAGRLGLVLAAVLLFAVFYEVLPTARWGRTPGKKLCGVRVLATATLRPPGFGAALLRWLVYAFLGLPGGLWCLVDRPRRQAWHDKAARTYVAR